MIKVSTIILSTLACALECIAFLIWRSPFFAVGGARWTGLLFHTAGCLLLSLAWLGTWHHMPNDAKSVFQLLIAFFFPGAGWGFSFILRLLPAISPQEAKVLQEIRQSEIAAFISPGAVIPGIRLQHSREIQPVIDLLLGTDPDLKREAIRRLALRTTPSSVSLLRQALLDPNGEIRLFAVNALQRIERQFIEQIEAAQRLVAEKPEDLESHLTLGKAFRRFSESGLLETLLQRMYLHKSLRAFEKGRMLFPERPSAWIASLELYMLIDETAPMERLLEQALERFPKDPAILLLDARHGFRKGNLRRTLHAVEALQRQRAISPELSATWPI